MPTYSEKDVGPHIEATASVHGITDTTALYRSGGTDVAVADGGTGASDAATARANLGAGTSNFSGAYADLTRKPTKVYLKDSQGTPHYWQLTVTTLGVLVTTDVGTTVPTDGVIGNA